MHVSESMSGSGCGGVHVAVAMVVVSLCSGTLLGKNLVTWWLSEDLHVAAIVFRGRSVGCQQHSLRTVPSTS